MVELKKQKAVLGIRLVFLPLKESNSFIARFFINKGISSKNFLTNKEIRAAISSSGFKEKSAIGSMSMQIEKYAATASFFAYYPFGYRGELKKFLLKKGIAQLLEYRVFEYVKKNFPNVKKIDYGEVTNLERLAALKKRGVTNFSLHKHDFEDAFINLGKKIARDTLVGRIDSLRSLRRK